MKNKYIILAVLAMSLTSCNDYLNCEPMSQISEDTYLSNVEQLESYVYDRYPELLNHKNSGASTMIGTDASTDDKTYNRSAVPLYTKGGAGVSVPTSGGLWNFSKIRKCNYFLEKVLPKYENNAIKGTPANIEQCIGEIYFFRAYEYFQKYRELGDMPIATAVPEMNSEVLIQKSKRQPRNEVARFILEDLDRAIDLLMDVSPDGQKTRLNKSAAYLFKSRVALFEGTWLKNFAGTPFVPNGAGWTGADAHPDYQYPAGSIEAEANWFLEQAMAASKNVADNIGLTQQNTDFSLQQSTSDAVNPYFDMFCDLDLSAYEEIIVWRSYNSDIGVSHGSGAAAYTGNQLYGLTKGLVESYLMRNGLPIYDKNSGYAGDDTTYDVVEDRDTRLQLFLKVPGQINKIFNMDENAGYAIEEPYPTLFHASQGYVTGYAIRKYGRMDGGQFSPGKSDTGCPLFRASEAYLNYIEASYMLNGMVDATASAYWTSLRRRAGVDEDFNKTIAATDMAREAEGDWGAYTAGNLVDPTLYNIRRERRNELMSEGFRLSDLRRWRSMDQMQNTPYIIKGFKIWNSTMTTWYDTSTFIECGQEGANISSHNDGDYICPLRVNAKNANYDGYVWNMAHYLTPIAANHFTMTGGGSSTIYQNPGWSTTGGDTALPLTF